MSFNDSNPTPAGAMPASLLNEREAASVLSIGLTKLRMGRAGQGELAGLKVVRIGGSVRYCLSDIHAFIAAATVIPTPAAAPQVAGLVVEQQSNTPKKRGRGRPRNTAGGEA